MCDVDQATGVDSDKQKQGEAIEVREEFSYGEIT